MQFFAERLPNPVLSNDATSRVEIFTFSRKKKNKTSIFNFLLSILFRAAKPVLQRHKGLHPVLTHDTKFQYPDTKIPSKRATVKSSIKNNMPDPEPLLHGKLHTKSRQRSTKLIHQDHQSGFKICMKNQSTLLDCSSQCATMEKSYHTWARVSKLGAKSDLKTITNNNHATVCFHMRVKHDQTKHRPFRKLIHSRCSIHVVA